MYSSNVFFRSAVLAVVFAAMAVGAFFAYQPKQHTGIDYLHFWAMPQIAHHLPEESIYCQDSHSKIFEWMQSLPSEQDNIHYQNLIDENRELYVDGIDPTGTPFLYSVFGVVQTGNYEVDYCAFQLVSNFLLIAGIFLLARIAGQSIPRCIALILVSLFVYASIIVDHSVANTNRLQVGLFAISMWLIWNSEAETEIRGLVRVIAGSFILGLLVAFKPNILLAPGLLLFSCFVDRRWAFNAQVMCGLTFGALIGILTGSLWFGSLESWFEWRDYAKGIVDSPFPMESGNSTFLAIADPSTIPILSIGITLFLGGALAIATWLTRDNHSEKSNQVERTSGRFRYVLIASSGLLVPLLSSPVAWSHYFLLGLPSIVLLIRTLSKESISTTWGKVLIVGWIMATILVTASPVTILRIADPYWITGLLTLGVTLLLVVVIVALFSNSSQKQDSLVTE